MQLDISTLFFVLGGVSILACGFAWFLYFNNRHIRGVKAVALSSSFFAIGFSAIALRAFLPAWLSFAAANIAIFYGYALVLYGVLVFSGKKANVKLLILCGAAYGAEYIYYYFIEDNYIIRLVCYLTVYAVICTIALAIIINDYQKNRFRSYIAASIFLTILAASFLICAAISIPSEGVKDIFSKTSINALVLYEQIIFVIGWLISFTLMVNERLLLERKNAELALIDKNNELERSNLDLEQFAYISSHDLQTPLRNIVRFSQLLESRYKGRLDKDADEFIGFIVHGGKHMSELIDDLLQYARITKQPFPPHPVRANEAIEHALGNLKVELEEAGAEIEVGEMPLVIAEPSLLTSLFQNLFGNSLKYRYPDRKLRLSVTAKRDLSDHWVFAVADNGIGIEPQYHDKIFEIFQRLDPVSNAEGTGIGLTLCRRIVHRFGGAIWLKSEPGIGTTFFFTLKDGSVST
ncbi:sensor histidine kinase [Paramagnetospirillum marisnigri]|uniref:sensor histidine kinase n=1 Tax=Paramagnetospirillum marisnigri TaxID=1285242 RepID=UPI0009ED03AB|nr:ATP-binding protein [Paramagnetospirillum marisnigri]